VRLALQAGESNRLARVGIAGVNRTVTVIDQLVGHSLPGIC